MDVELLADLDRFFPEAYETSTRILQGLRTAHAENTVRLAAEGVPSAAAIIGLGRFLLEDCTAEAVSSALAVAIVELDRKDQLISSLYKSQQR